MAAAASPTPRGSRSKTRDPSRNLENFDPNKHSPVPKPSCSFSSSSSSSPLASKSQRPNPKNPTAVGYYSPQNKIRQRKFLVAKKKKEREEEEGGAGSCKCRGSGANKNNKCVCVAYNNLRKSQEEFFKNNDDDEEGVSETESECAVEEEKEGELGGNEVCSLVAKRRRERLMEEARESVPQSGSGKVMHLVKAFEKLLSVPATKEDEESQEKDNKVGKWALPGLQQVPTTSEVSGSLFCPPNCVLTSENLGLDPGASVSSSWDSGRASVSSRTSTGGRRSRRNSLESSSTFGRRKWKKKQQKVTSQKPFKLRTEQRGKLKEEEFVKKIQEMAAEEEKQRIPVAQGLPWTTDEPECLVKPLVKEITRPVDLKLHSDVRALDRADFDHQVAEKLSLIEQYKLERERQQKLAKEEEVRRLRKELIPKAQPMPYFDRPFIPRRSMKCPTIPREPKFHNHKKIKCSLSSWTDMSPYSSCLN
ncbi:TPX2 protein [Spatholobus suberectus]|nr:TPX2 protein [Spatholobus suberectus]